MIHETDKINNLTVEELNFDLNSYISEFIKDKGLETNVREADVLLLPYSGFKEVKGPVFPEAYSQFYDYLLENLKDNNVELCVEEDDYKEVALHDETVNLGLILLTGIVLPVISNLISEYIKSLRDNKKVNVKVSFIEKEGDKYRKFDYEGDSRYLTDTIETYLKKRD
jgi:hypothetical protein